MKLGNLAGGVCRICGSDTYGNDIGCGCKAMYEEAKFICLKNHKDESIKYYWGIKLDYVMTHFVQWYDDLFERHDGQIEKMFRTKFNRSFYPSVYEQYEKSGFTSKKQLEIIQYKIFPPETQEEIAMLTEVDTLKDGYMKMFVSTYDNEIVEIARNLWKMKKGEKVEVIA